MDRLHFFLNDSNDSIRYVYITKNDEFITFDINEEKNYNCYYNVIDEMTVKMKKTIKEIEEIDLIMDSFDIEISLKDLIYYLNKTSKIKTQDESAKKLISESLEYLKQFL